MMVCAFLAASGCAYRLGSPDRSLPGGYRQVFVPVFKNKSMEPGIEVDFTNALIQEFERAKIARVTDQHQAEIIALGVIEAVDYSSSGRPEEGVLATQYSVVIRVSVTLVRNTDKSVVWSGSFSGERTYVAPQVKASVINTVNPLYNLSARRQNIGVAAAKMMAEAHDRMTENF
ncbi:MAG: hypothetical protein COT73_11760 [Bdellovibrio sp. CG10_big_fil_rev_8_21_14_0_10_47_8]|nr:MAG: hypothetical protein COT73_11760 [Bdellovibrio sp. CG10_big_fil_rev_8_21_14_0_10_47_8]